MPEPSPLLGQRRHRSPAAKTQGVQLGDLIDARGKIVGWEDDFTAIVEFSDGNRGLNRCSVPILALTWVAPDVG